VWGSNPQTGVSTHKSKGGPTCLFKKVAENPEKLRHKCRLLVEEFRYACLAINRAPPLGRAWRETDEAGANRATLVRNLLDGQYESPVRIVAFNTAEGWSRDVTVDIADDLRRRYVEFDDVPESVLAFLEASNRR